MGPSPEDRLVNYREEAFRNLCVGSMEMTLDAGNADLRAVKEVARAF